MIEKEGQICTNGSICIRAFQIPSSYGSPISSFMIYDWRPSTCWVCILYHHPWFSSTSPPHLPPELHRKFVVHPQRPAEGSIIMFITVFRAQQHYLIFAPTKLTGWKSEMLSVPFFLGMRHMKIEYMLLTNWPYYENPWKDPWHLPWLYSTSPWRRPK